jgi:hypothetical protein
MGPNEGVQGLDCGASANEYSCAHGAQINFGDITPYLTSGVDPISTILKNCVVVLTILDPAVLKTKDTIPTKGQIGSPILAHNNETI